VDVNLIDLCEQYGSEDKCRAYLEELRWPDGVVCPRCEGATISRIRARNQFDCDSCRYQFSVTAGTLMHDSHLPLFKWFLAIYLMVESKKSISAKQLQRMLKVSYKTAWYLQHRIRDAMGDTDDPPLRGIVEVDETYFGGKRRGPRGTRKSLGRPGAKDTNKAMVVGAVSRDGQVRLKVAPNAKKATLHKFVADHIAPDAEAIYTDEWAGYQGIGDADTRHETIQHSAGEYVRGDVSTNAVESVWSLFKRAVVGSYHQVSMKHLPAYVDEIEWRFNGRDNPFLFRDTLVVLLFGEPLPLKKLVHGSPTPN
jgi:transposase-like protein